MARRRKYQASSKEVDICLLEIFNALYRDFQGNLTKDKFQILHKLCGRLLVRNHIPHTIGMRLIRKINRIYLLRFPPEPKKLVRSHVVLNLERRNGRWEFPQLEYDGDDKSEE